MGILNRDYMKRPAGDDGERGSASDSQFEAFLDGFLQRHPRFFVYVVVVVVAVIIVGLLIAKFAGKAQ